MRHSCFPAALRSPEAYCAHSSVKLTMEIRAGTNVVNLRLDTSRNNSRWVHEENSHQENNTQCGGKHKENRYYNCSVPAVHSVLSIKPQNSAEIATQIVGHDVR